MKTLFILALALSAAPYAAAIPTAGAAQRPTTVPTQLSPASLEFLKRIGLDPASPDVVAAAQDVIGRESLENVIRKELATDGEGEDVRKFIGTRKFARGFAANPTHVMPPEYEPRYLKPEEQTLIGRHVADYYMGRRPGPGMKA